MKYGILGILLGLIFLVGCGIEKKINNATDKCENIVSEALEGLEGTCLTKEDILYLINSSQTNNNNDTMCFCDYEN
jgi:hypothetical protein